MSARTRLLLVGPAAAWDRVVETAGDALEPRFVDVRLGDPPTRLQAAIDDHDPDVIAVLDPALVPSGVLGEARAATLALIEAPISAALAQAYDRVVACAPGVTGGDGPVWRTLPLPVNDEILDAPWPATGQRVGFFGAWTPRTEHFLLSAKHSYELLHIDSGASGRRLLDLFQTVSIAVHVNELEGDTFHHRVLTHLAAGHVLVSEKLAPRYGLAPGIEYVEVSDRHELHIELGRTQAITDLHRKVRLRGRRAAQWFRASDVYARLVHDLRHDLAAFGTRRIRA